MHAVWGTKWKVKMSMIGNKQQWIQTDLASTGCKTEKWNLFSDEVCSNLSERRDESICTKKPIFSQILKPGQCMTRILPTLSCKDASGHGTGRFGCIAHESSLTKPCIHDLLSPFLSPIADMIVPDSPRLDPNSVPLLFHTMSSSRQHFSRYHRSNRFTYPPQPTHQPQKKFKSAYNSSHLCNILPDDIFFLIFAYLPWEKAMILNDTSASVAKQFWERIQSGWMFRHREKSVYRHMHWTHSEMDEIVTPDVQHGFPRILIDIWQLNGSEDADLNRHPLLSKDEWIEKITDYSILQRHVDRLVRPFGWSLEEFLGTLTNLRDIFNDSDDDLSTFLVDHVRYLFDKDLLQHFFRKFEDNEEDYLSTLMANLPASYRADKEIMLRVFDYSDMERGHLLEFCSDELKDDLGFALKVVEKDHPSAVEFVSPDLLNSTANAIAFIATNSDCFALLPESYTENRICVSVAVCRKGSCLEHASDDLQDDKGIVLLALDKSDDALRYVSLRLLRDPEVLRHAYRHVDEVDKWKELFPEELYKDKEFIRLLSTECTMDFLKLADKSLLKDFDFMLEMGAHDCDAFRFCRNSLWKNKNFAMAAMSVHHITDSDLLLKIARAHHADREVALSIVSRNWGMLCRITRKLQRDPVILSKAWICKTKGGVGVTCTDDLNSVAIMLRNVEFEDDVKRAVGDIVNTKFILELARTVRSSVISSCTMILKHANTVLWRRSEFTFSALQMARKEGCEVMPLVRYIPHEDLGSKTFVLQAIESGGAIVLLACSEELKRNEDIITAALSTYCGRQSSSDSNNRFLELLEAMPSSLRMKPAVRAKIRAAAQEIGIRTGKILLWE